MPSKNLPLNLFFAEPTVLLLKVNCKTFLVVILDGICVLALNSRVNSLRENCSCNHNKEKRLKKTKTRLTKTKTKKD